MYWFEFFASAAVIIFAGTRLTVCADRIGDELHIGKVWIGVILLGVATSLPEAITSLTAIISLQANDLAIGNLLGSNSFNPMIIVVMDVLYRQGSVTNAVHPKESHKVSAGFAMALAFLVIFDIIFNRMFPAFHFGPISIGGALIAVFYFYGVRRLWKLGAGDSVISSVKAGLVKEGVSIQWIWVQFAVSTAFVIAGAMWMAKSADTIAFETGLGRTFVGSIFLAIATSLPELVVSLSALKLREFDLAIGNIFGSNMVNMFILFICGLFYPARPILATVSPTHIFTAALSILLVYVAIRGIFERNKKTVLGMGWDSIIMILLFIAGTSCLYSARGL